MNDIERFERIKRKYRRSIKPELENRRYSHALVELGNLINLMRYTPEIKKLIAEYHSGDNFVSSGEELQAMLLEGSFYEGSEKKFEMCMGQFGLAIKSGNRY